VTLTGSNFTGASAVEFGITNATSFTVKTATQITATAPAGSGIVDITVTTPGGTSSTGTADRYTYVPAPTVTGVSPGAGGSSGGTLVSIFGLNLAGATAVKFGSVSANTFTVYSPTQITATAPAGSGTVDITVTTVGGTSSIGSADQFTYLPAPVVIGVSPPSGPASGGAIVTITGINFTGATAVKFGTTSAGGFTVNGNQISVNVPAGSGTVDVTVTTPGGTSSTSKADQYMYVAAPAVTGIRPNSGPLAGGTSVTITGTNLSGATALNFGSASATSFTVESATQITAMAPAGSGTVDITVTSEGGTSPTSAADQYTYALAPAVTAINPSAGPTYGGNTVSVGGANFTGATAVHFGSQSAPSFTVITSNLISAIAPSQCSGAVDITVTSPGGTSSIGAADRYTYGTAQNRVTDVQLGIDEALGTTMPTNDINGDGVVNVVDIQIFIDGLLNVGCISGNQSNQASQARILNSAPPGSIASNSDGAAGKPAHTLDLGTLGGSISRAYGIDNFGRVVGESETGSQGDCRSLSCPVRHAFLWQSEHMTDLGLMMGAADLASVAYGVNDAGQVAGFNSVLAEKSAGFLYGAGSAVPLSNLPNSRARAVNLHGQVVGDFSRGAGASETRAFLWSAGVALDLGTFGGADARAFAISNLGQVVGTARLPGNFASHAFSYAGSGLTDLGTLGGANSTALGINDVGQIVGVAQVGNGSPHAFLYDGGLMTDLGTLGGAESQASGINDHGLIVGWARTADGRRHAFVWSAGRMIDLNTLGGLTENVLLEEATAINDLRQIVCNGSNGRGYLVTLPEEIR